MGNYMSTIINATTTNGVVIQPDNSGSLVLQTNSGTTALTIDTSQRAAFVAGTAAAPAITTTGDTNTGIFFSAADTIDFAKGGTSCGQFDSSANFKFNSGYGSVATAYGCRAWVNFDGTSNATNLTGTYSQTGTTVTVTITNHGYITGNKAYLDFTSGTAVDGAYEVTVTGVNTFTVTQASRTTSGNVTSVRSNIRASGNVSSITDNGTGDYTVNFATAMPDINYSATIGWRVFASVNIRAGGFDNYTTGSIGVYGGFRGGSNAFTAEDTTFVSVAIFR
jgi:hypothetical protein